METNYTNLYIEQNKLFIKTVVIKLSKVADNINEFINLKYGTGSVNVDDQSSWKYYKHLAGEYHVTDTLMYITSLDTLELIVFSKDTLATHPTTKDAYQYGSRYYDNLLNTYPEQERLIFGIIYPAVMQEVLDAEEGSIVNYITSLVEPQEITLIPELAVYIKNYLSRWDVKSFGLSDSLYHTAQLAVMYLNLVPKLLNLRLKRCKTNEAHSFHIREYLASHNYLDKYIPYMTLEQTLYLYRNIVYIENNSGKASQFKELIDVILSKRKIPLNELSVRLLSNYDDNYYPDIIIRRKAVNPQFNVPESNTFSTDILFNKETPLAYGNTDYIESNKINILNKLKNSSSSAIQTKNLESVMVDYSDAVPDPLATVLLRELAFMVSNNLYSGNIEFKNPKTGNVYSLEVLDAFIYMYYVSLKSIGIDVQQMPDYMNIKQRKRYKPTLNKMLSVTDKRFTDLKDIATNILVNQPDMTICNSPSSFFKLANIIYEQSLSHWHLVSRTEDMYKRANVANMILTLYEDKKIKFPVQTNSMDDWLVLKNLPPYDFTYDQAILLIKELVTNMTGLVIDPTKSIKNIQRAMLEILTKLSSYSIQFMQEINQSNIVPLNWAAIRLGNIVKDTVSSNLINIGCYIVDVTGESISTHVVENNMNKDFNKITLINNTDVSLPIGSMDIAKNAHRASMILIYPAVTIAEDNVYGNYLDLTDVEKKQIKSIYN